MSDISEDVEVLAKGANHYYIADNSILRAVPFKLVVTKHHEDCSDEPPTIYEVLPYIAGGHFEDVDHSLDDLFSTVH